MASIITRHDPRQQQQRSFPDPAGVVLTRLPAIRLLGVAPTKAAYLSAGGALVGIPATAICTYSRTCRELLSRHGVILRLARIENAESPKKAADAWRRQVARSLRWGRDRL